MVWWQGADSVLTETNIRQISAHADEVLPPHVNTHANSVIQSSINMSEFKKKRKYNTIAGQPRLLTTSQL